MVLVLAFSVQGIADALTFGTSRTGDLQTKLPNEDFTITFHCSPWKQHDTDKKAMMESWFLLLTLPLAAVLHELIVRDIQLKRLVALIIGSVLLHKF